MAEAFVRTIKRDYVHVSPCPDPQTVMHQLSAFPERPDTVTIFCELR